MRSHIFFVFDTYTHTQDKWQSSECATYALSSLLSTPSAQLHSTSSRAAGRQKEKNDDDDDALLVSWWW